VTVERALRLIAGAFVALSVLLGIFVNANFLWFTLFVGVNLFQSAFTNWCPMMAILRKGGLTDAHVPGTPVTGAR
jgi:Inner membrane protein YgaP-like, transmembrane domain